MKVFFILIISILISSTLFSQTKLKLNWNKSEYLFYQTRNIKKLPFVIENYNNELKKTFKELKNDINNLKKVTLDKNEDGCHLSGFFVFKKNPDVKNFKELLEKLNIQEFYVNDKKILTKTLITEEEAYNKAIGFEYRDQVFNTIFNDTSRIEYYDFQIYYAKTKLVYMYSKNYPKYLYDGYVAKYTELQDKQEKAREEFLKRTKNSKL